VVIERLGHQTGWAWVPTAHATARRDGSFTAVWNANHIGRFAIRAVIRAGGRAGSASPMLTVTVYRPSVATYYGSGSWGSMTACGVTLRRNTLGVAHKTLPCGTKVAFYWGGRTIVVPVIDRGPYGNADWDLTQATAHALGYEQQGIVTLGAVSLPRKP
jgi:rare lipoprotein A (peptidoglycan hydrolase)